MESIQHEMAFFQSLVKGIAAQFGENCEVVLHDLTRPYESTIVAIENGHITGRKTGDPGTNLGLELLKGTVKDGNRFNYMTQTKDGRILRSTSLYIHDASGKPIGSLCMNFDITDLKMAEQSLKSLINFGTNDEVKETFVSNVNDLLDTLIQQTQEIVGKPVALMSKEDKMKFISLLDEKGAFLIKKSGEKVCAYLNISKFSLYSYMDVSKSSDQGGEHVL
ncbi:helix-turn-helix transcriptional regulator [Cohnella silvisoli]|uniref:Helix-turn-helix transcriptional regulator n=1 Tax=Cohnella silvisoli TaxID=2873699 RepID=A0ABV1L2K5_9BACL|nr:helix-turn-helix transcriptional regulator [Cohnella silvisoli]MCD9025868.1 helix-turn-helix transcriptional regulator [Cohnella silvisoli]